MNKDFDFQVRELATWFDVERRVFAFTRRLTKLPAPIVKVSVYPTALELYVRTDSDAPAAIEAASAWFSDSEFSQENGDPCIFLNVGSARLPVIVESEANNLKTQPLLPLWEQIVYLPLESQQQFESPKGLPSNLSMFAFHSFKGGVGRTTALLAFAAAYAKTSKKKVFLIDADIEAPGITYWLSNAQRGTVSFTGLLEALHSPPTNIEDSIKHFALEIQKSAINLDGHEFFVLPAFKNTIELLNAKVSPQHLIRTENCRWLLGDALSQIAVILNANAVFVDLRAGLSELSSPVLFDSRFKRYLVTTLAEQSLSGIELTLNMLRRARNALPDSILNSNAKHPSLVFSMLTEELKTSTLYTSAHERMEISYGGSKQPEKISNLESELAFFEAPFSPDLMAIKSIETAFSLVQKTKIYEDAIGMFKSMEDETLTQSSSVSLDGEASALARTAAGRVYAEAQVPKGLLTTEALRNLGRAFIGDVPNAVLIGAKGSGKTFSFLQIAISQTWDKFLKELGLNYVGTDAPTIIPFLRSRELNDANLKSVSEIYEKAQESFRLDPNQCMSISHIPDLVVEELSKGSIQLSDWVYFWVRTLAKSINSQASTLQDLSQELQAKKRKVVFLIDGLEDILRDVPNDPVQKIAVEAVIDLPNRVRELRNSHLGILAYVREDFAKAVKTQNFGQFQSRYEKFQLNWSPREFLQLVYWLSAEANIIGARAGQVDSMSTSELIDALQKLWGKKLGRDDAAEAYSARWVYAAVCDLRGQLQARDVVRFLALSASQAPSKRVGVWLDRVLPPAALRAALPLLSEQKVSEAIEEYPSLKNWSEILRTVDPEKKRMPFSAENTGLDSSSRQSLQSIGVIYEDIEKTDAERLYVPEIYRQGLGIGSNAGARPRVQALLQRALGSLPF